MNQMVAFSSFITKAVDKSHNKCLSSIAVERRCRLQKNWPHLTPASLPPTLEWKKRLKLNVKVASNISKFVFTSCCCCCRSRNAKTVKMSKPKFFPALEVAYRLYFMHLRIQKVIQIVTAIRIVQDCTKDDFRFEQQHSTRKTFGNKACG